MKIQGSHGVMVLSLALCIVAAACGGDSSRDGASAGDVIWQGNSDGYRITMRKDDIIAHDATGQCYSARKDGLTNRKAGVKPPVSPEMALAELQRAGCTGFEQAMVISVVGPIMSTSSYHSMKCPTHASAHAGYSSFDLSGQSEELLLTDFFDSTDIFHALMAQPLVQRTLANGNVPSPINSLTELIYRLRDITTECEYQFTEDLLRRFAFHHIEGENVAVEFGLDLGVQPCQPRPTALTILLPIPPSLAGSLKHAANGTQGILKQEMEKAIGESAGAILMKLEGPDISLEK